mgnify:CR=1 FL=1
MSKLTQKKCQPCEGIGEAYDKATAESKMEQITGWKIAEDGKSITREFITKNFVAAVTFIQKIADVAEAEDHHPDIHLTGYRKLRIDLSTHALGGLTENDFIVAAKINELPVELKE